MFFSEKNKGDYEGVSFERREVDHNELVSGAKPPAKAPYRMSSPELEELQKQACSKVVSSVGQGFYSSTP